MTKGGGAGEPPAGTRPPGGSGGRRRCPGMPTQNKRKKENWRFGNVHIRHKWIMDYREVEKLYLFSTHHYRCTVRASLTGELPQLKCV